MRLKKAVCKPASLFKVRKTVLLAVSLIAISSLCGASAWATAQEENTEPTSKFETSAVMDAKATMLPEPLQISELPTSAYSAGEASQAFRQQISAVTAYVSNYNRALAGEEAANIAQAIVEYSNRYGVDYRLVTSLIAVESSFRHNAISSSGAIGMGQLKPDTARWLGVVDPYDPVDNIAGTTRFLAWLVHRYNGNLEAALSAYYQGPGFVDKNGITDICMPYLEKVNRALGRLL